MNEQLREKLRQSLAVAKQAKDLLDTLPPKVLMERAAEFCEDSYQIAEYAKQAAAAKGDELAELMFCLGGLAGSLQYQIYELTEQQEARRSRNRRLAHLLRVQATAKRFAVLRQQHGHSKAIGMLAAETGLSDRQISSRLSQAGQADERQLAELEAYQQLSWFAEFERHAERFLAEGPDENFE